MRMRQEGAQLIGSQSTSRHLPEGGRTLRNAFAADLRYIVTASSVAIAGSLLLRARLSTANKSRASRAEVKDGPRPQIGSESLCDFPQFVPLGKPNLLFVEKLDQSLLPEPGQGAV